jgi:hypothetical protein
MGKQQFIADPDKRYGRFKVLQRTDGLYVVHEKDQVSGVFRFGPVFRTLVEAQWRAYHRASGEKASSLKIGQQVRVGQSGLGFVVDFVAALGVTDVRGIEVAVRVGPRTGVYPLEMVTAAQPSKEGSDG